MALHWYLKKEYFDTADDIEQVLIHFACTPLGGTPDWTQAESRAMPAGELLRTGVGEVAKYGPPAPVVPQEVHPRLRKKVLRCPTRSSTRRSAPGPATTSSTTSMKSSATGTGRSRPSSWMRSGRGR